MSGKLQRMGLDLILDLSRFSKNVEIIFVVDGVDEVDDMNGVSRNDVIDLIGDSMQTDEFDIELSDVMEETVNGKDNEVTGCEGVDLVGEMKTDEFDIELSDVMEETVDGKDDEVTDCDDVDLVSEMKADELDMDRSLLDVMEEFCNGGDNEMTGCDDVSKVIFEQVRFI